MAGYVANERVLAVRVGRAPVAGVHVARSPASIRDAGPVLVELSAPRLVPLLERLRAAAATLGEQWSMTTFYLFDPESWR